MQCKALVALCVLSSIVLCNSLEFTFTGNFTSTQVNNNNWTYRETTFSEINAPGVYIGANVWSGVATGTKNGHKVDGTVDIVGASTYCTVGNFPASFVCNFEKDYNLNFGGQGAASLDVKGSLGYIAMALLGLVEKDPNGTVVSVQTLRWTLALNPNGLTYGFTEMSQPADDIQYVTVTGTSNDPDNQNFNFTITYLASAHAGIVNGEFGLVPGSLESIYGINNYPYASSTNTLSLVIAVATGAGKVSKSGRTVVSNNSTVYVSVSKEAKINGANKQIVVSEFTSASLDDLGNSNIAAQLQAKYAGSGTVQVVNVTFPPGAQYITYDPSIGAGASVQESTADASSSHDSAASALATLLAAFVAFAVALMVLA